MKRSILQQLYLVGTVTIAQLTRALHASVPSVTALIEELMLEKWIVDVGTADAQFGRKPALYALNNEDRFVLVLDITVHDTKIFIFNCRNEVIVRRDTPLGLENNPAFLTNLLGSVDLVLDEASVRLEEIVAVGVSMPGLVDPDNGVNHTYQNLSPNHSSLGEQLEKHFARPVYLLNDSKATALGEHRFGLLRGKRHALSINIDWGGMGLGVILNGEVFQGASGFAGELGHIPVKPDGDLCQCGKIGCLDTIASATSVVKRVKSQLREGQISRLADMDIDLIDIRTVIDAANFGDAFAIDLLHDLGKELGRGLSMAVHLFNPEAIVVNGVLAKAGKFISNPIEQVINKYCFADFRNNLSISMSELGEMAKPYGVQIYVMEHVLDSQ
ncbi:DNA-binding transcriptional regulator NagC [Nibrella saemangeumensis]|uniref:DNA-binding transcriptional regulator NagC n=1 Tax=Nibrella saemangeumensis TaxID=1084526 RepID=A0ABP8NL42_9BACT